MNTTRDLGMALQQLDRLLVPGRRKHHRDGKRHPRLHQPLERQVDAVAHPGIVAANEQICRRRWRRPARKRGLTSGVGRREESPARPQQKWDGTMQPRTVLPNERITRVLFNSNGNTDTRRPGMASRPWY